MIKLKKNKQEKDAAPAKVKSAKVGMPADSFIKTLILPLLLVFLLCGAALYYLQGGKSAVVSAPVDTAAAVAGQLAGGLSHYPSSLQNYLSEFQVGMALQSNDEEALRRHEARIKTLFPQILRARLLPPEWNQKDQFNDPALSFASFDLLRSVEKSAKPSAAEVHQLGGALPHIALAVPVVASSTGEVVGVLHVALPFSLVKQSLSGIQSAQGSLEVRQLVGGKSAVLVGVNNRNAEMVGTVPVKGAIWQVAYGAPVVEVDWVSQLLPLGVLLAGALIMLPLLLAQGKRLSAALETDSASALALLEEIKSGAGARPPAARIAELQSLLELVRRLASSSSVKGKPAKVPEETPETPDTDVTAGGGKASAAPALGAVSPPATHQPVSLDRSVFRAYDIRGVVGSTLTEELVYQLGLAIGSEAYDKGQQSVIIGRDGRNSGPALSQALASGLMASGRDVIDIGMVPTPVLYFATHFLGANTGVMLTGSHNPADYNGLKIVMAGEAMSGDAIQGLADRIEQGNLLQGSGSKSEQDLLPDYLDRITSDVQLGRALKVVVDCGNGVAGVVVPALLQVLGCEIIPLYCDVDGTFPNHHPDPGKLENLNDLIAEVVSQGADLGVAFDGDGDRLGVVDGKGKVIWPDRLLMLLAQDVLSRQPGADVIYDVKSSRHLAPSILSNGGRPIMWKTGHSLIKAKMKETGALLAGEMSGHIFFKERWYGFDDGIYSCARLLEVLSLAMDEPAAIFAELPESQGTPEITLWFDQEGENFSLMEQILAAGEMEGGKLTTIDGLRADFADGWGLVRPSNTTPALVFRFEADTQEALKRIQSLFRERILQVAPDLELPF